MGIFANGLLYINRLALQAISESEFPYDKTQKTVEQGH